MPLDPRIGQRVGFISSTRRRERLEGRSKAELDCREGKVRIQDARVARIPKDSYGSPKESDG
eukprot:4777561-Pyramimonas_sp.AAC.1